MTGEVFNLRQKRKERARAEHDKQAEANRLLHGRTKAEKLASRLRHTEAQRQLDGHKREAPSSSES